MNKIPLFSLSRQNNVFTVKVMKKWKEIWLKNQFVNSPYISSFERAFAKFNNSAYAIGVKSGTSALVISLKALGIGEGDEVITTPCTFSATADAIVLVGAQPVFVDVEEKTGNIASEEIEKAISRRTKAIIVVHLYGVVADMENILKVAKKHKLFVVEDASHAHGSRYKDSFAGSMGDVGCFSLYPSKTLGGGGSSGVVITNSRKIMEKVRALSNHGITNLKKKYAHSFVGFNELIDSVQAVVVLEKLSYLKKWISAKRKIAEKYNKIFTKNGLDGMHRDNNFQKPSLYVFSVQVSERKKLQKYLSQNLIETGIYYPIPLHLQESYKFLGYKKGSFPKAEAFFSQTISLPLYPGLKAKEVKHVCDTLERYFNSVAKKERKQKN